MNNPYRFKSQMRQRIEELERENARLRAEASNICPDCHRQVIRVLGVEKPVFGPCEHPKLLSP